MLEHGYEGVRQIEAHVTNTMGWSATTGEVAALGLSAAHPDLRARPGRCGNGWPRSIPTASAKVANRLLEAHERNYWQPGDADARRAASAGEELEDRLEGIVRRSGRMTCNGSRTGHPRMRRRGRTATAACRCPRSHPQDRQCQGVRGLRQGRHRQEHDLVEFVGRVLQARQARAADRLRSQARLDLHAHQAPGADRDRRARIGQLPFRGAAGRGLRLSKATTA